MSSRRDYDDPLLRCSPALRRAIIRTSKHHERNKARLAQDKRTLERLNANRERGRLGTIGIVLRLMRLRYQVARTGVGFAEVGAELARLREMLDEQPQGPPAENARDLPLTRFSALLARLYTPRFHAKRIQQAIFDVQIQYADAISSGIGNWECRWIVARGYIVITWRVLLPLVPIMEFIRNLMEIFRA